MNPIITRAVGERAEILFSNALMKRGFVVEGEHTNEVRGEKWKKSKHNLDFILSKDNIIYGCEIKNTLAYINKYELDIKLEMCDYFGIRPLFIVRAAPKNYIYEIQKVGGYTLIFETQIYPLGQEKLAEKVKETLELPVICSNGIPKGMIDRFMNWHQKHVNFKTKSPN